MKSPHDINNHRWTWGTIVTPPYRSLRKSPRSSQLEAQQRPTLHDIKGKDDEKARFSSSRAQRVSKSSMAEASHTYYKTTRNVINRFSRSTM